MATVFCNSLARLREASYGQRGQRDGEAVVKLADLRALLHHFDRIDAELRTLNASFDVIPPSPGSEYVHRTRRERYLVEEVLPVKIAGAWRDRGLTVYEREGVSYARLTPDFLENFEFVSDGE